MRFFHQSRARLDGPRRFGLAGRRLGRPNHQALFVAVTLARCWKVLVVGAVAVVMPFSHVRAQQLSEEDIAKFQLYTACQPMTLVVEELNDDAEDIELTEQAVVNAVESRLRAARLYNPSGIEYLYVNINVVSPAYSIILEFKKPVLDRYSRRFLLASTWRAGSTGTSRNASYIIGSLSRHLDRFLVEFLRVNESACNDPQ